MAVVCRFNGFGNAVALKLSRRFIAQARVHARSVVPALDVSKYALLGLIAGHKILHVGQAAAGGFFQSIRAVLVC